jgi:4-amino-4-deoxychorismate lyase
LPAFSEAGTHKFRLLYDEKSFSIESAPYQARTIKTVKMVNADHLDYGFKFSDRSEINDLVELAGTDEIIMIKNGLITDASYANIACFDGKTWWTPQVPLLAGVKRAELLNKGVLKTRVIRHDELHQFNKICLINAMLDVDEVSLKV